MLSHLSVRDLAVVDSLSVEFEAGLTVLTGETGAGKSILVDALGLALGARASAQMVREGRQRAEVTALFDLGTLDGVRSLLQELELDDGESELHLRRTISSDGRSRGFVNGRPVPGQVLRRLGAALVDIHGQHEHQSLLDSAVQRGLLDAFAGNESQVESVQAAHARWRTLRQELDTLTGQSERGAQRALLEYQVAELDELAPEDGEFETAREELSRLSRADDQRDRAMRAAAIVADDDGAEALIRRAIGLVAAIAQDDPGIKPAAELLESAAIHLEEASGALRDFAEEQHDDPARSAELEDRLNRLQEVARKHHARPELLGTLHTDLADELRRLEAASTRADTIEADLQAAREAHTKACARLTRARRKAATAMSKAITANMVELGMPGGTCQIAVAALDDAEPHAHGADRVDLLFSANPGATAQPLRRAASGGELSRVSLAVQVILAGDSGVPTLVFDEVDVGIGGRVAEIVGTQLRAVGAHRQVLCVTHLAQVACQGHGHLRVQKQLRAGTAHTVIERLDTDARVEEVARMLGGVEITERTVAHAREMLDLAGNVA